MAPFYNRADILYYLFVPLLGPLLYLNYKEALLELYPVLLLKLILWKLLILTHFRQHLN